MSLNNSRFSNFLHLIYPSEHEIKGTTDTGKFASYIKMDSWERVMQNSTTIVMTLPFLLWTPHSTVAIFQQHWCMKFQFTMHIYFIIWFVPGKVIFWSKLSCWRKNYSSKAMFLLISSHQYNHYRVITTLRTVTIYPFLKYFSYAIS